jgi:hypothetical protein
MWKLIVIYAPILGATLIGGALTIDEYHNWYDILAGAIVGTVMAFSAYRMTYAAIWDWRYNHIPLNRGAAFGFGSGEVVDAVFTRKAGWGGRVWETHGDGHGHGVNGHGHGHAAGPSIPRRAVGTGRRGDDMV